MWIGAFCSKQGSFEREDKSPWEEVSLLAIDDRQAVAHWVVLEWAREKNRSRSGTEAR